MAAFRDWVKACFETVVDPDKQGEVTDLTQLLYDGMVKLRKQFKLDEVLGDREYKERHLQQAKINVYQKLLNRAWSDGEIQPVEKETLRWAAGALELSPHTVQSINWEAARPRFAESLAAAMDDGVITEQESAALREIANSAGSSLQDFVQKFFRAEGEAFLRGIFAAAVEKHSVPADAIDRLVATAARVGLTRGDLFEAIQPQAVRYVEHVLADVKDDGSMSAEEETRLKDLTKLLPLPRETLEYVYLEMETLRELTNIATGKLPTLEPPQGISLRAGELVHFHGPAIWRCLKVLKSGPSSNDFDGDLTITDSRLIFDSRARSESFSFGRVVAFNVERQMIEVQFKGKPTQQFFLGDGRQIGVAVFRSALAMANQTLINQDDSRRSRHIPREIRQRVWQKYSGQCAECSATSYLEFDHIIPVAKGGSNSESNVQLLCRNCNLKKSDLI